MGFLESKPPQAPGACCWWCREVGYPCRQRTRRGSGHLGLASGTVFSCVPELQRGFSWERETPQTSLRQKGNPLGNKIAAPALRAGRATDSIPEASLSCSLCSRLPGLHQPTGWPPSTCGCLPGALATSSSRQSLDLVQGVCTNRVTPDES